MAFGPLMLGIVRINAVALGHLAGLGMYTCYWNLGSESCACSCTTRLPATLLALHYLEVHACCAPCEAKPLSIAAHDKFTQSPCNGLALNFAEEAAESCVKRPPYACEVSKCFVASSY